MISTILEGRSRGDRIEIQAFTLPVAHGLAHVGLKHSKPVIFGVLTTDNQEQAMDRSGGKHGNKGSEAAITAIQMAAIAAAH